MSVSYYIDAESRHDAEKKANELAQRLNTDDVDVHVAVLEDVEEW